MNYALSAEILARTPEGPILVAEWHTSRPLTLRRARKRLAKRIRRSRAAAYEVRRSPLYPLAFEITAHVWEPNSLLGRRIWGKSR